MTDFFKNSLYWIAIWPNNPTAGDTHWGNQNWKRHTCPSVHRSTVYNSSDVEATYKSISRWMDKEVVIHRHNGILLSYKKEHIRASSNETDETGAHYTEWSKSEKQQYSITIAIAKSLQSCLALCDPTDGSPPPGSPVPGILQARTLEWVAISFSSAWKWKVKVKLLSDVRLSDPHGLQPSRPLHPWDFPGKSPG